MSGVFDSDQIAAQTRQRVAGQIPDAPPGGLACATVMRRPIAKGRLGRLVKFGRKAHPGHRQRRPRQRSRLDRDCPSTGHHRRRGRLRFDPESPITDGRWPYDR